MISRLVRSITADTFRAKSLLCYIISLITGLCLTLCFNRLFPKPAPHMPDSAIAASFIIHLAGLGVLLAWLPENAASRCVISAWLKSVLVCAAAYCGMIISRPGETGMTFFALWCVFAAQSAVVAAGFGMLSMFLNSRTLPRQVTLLLLSAAATALLWSREPIQAAGHLSPEGRCSALLAEGVLKLSPVGAVASAWYQESDSARAQAGRFDLMGSVLTYDQWIGRTGLTIGYPQVFPAHVGEGAQRQFAPGIVLAMLLWSLPLMALRDLLAASSSPPKI